MRSIHLLVSVIVLNACYLLMPGTASAQDETNFVPIEPCRLFDTRPGDPMGAGETRDFFVFEVPAGAIAGQGGNEGGCGIPTDAVAIHVNFTAVNAEGPGFMRAWSFCDSQPNATLLNYFGLLNVSNATAVGVCFGAADLTVRTVNNATDLVADAVGYYVPVPSILKELAAEERAQSPAPLSRP